jgi:hypothetical protein
VCPVDCIPLDPEHVETKEHLYEKYLAPDSQESVSHRRAWRRAPFLKKKNPPPGGFFSS